MHRVTSLTAEERHAVVSGKRVFYLGRVIRDIECKMQSEDTRTERLDKLLEIAAHIHSQPRTRSQGDPPKLYSGSRLAIPS